VGSLTTRDGKKEAKEQKKKGEKTKEISPHAGKG